MSDSKKIKVMTSDIYTYIVFAVIDKRNGTMQGHEVLLTKEQRDAIEQIILSQPVKVLETKEFDFEVKK